MIILLANENTDYRVMVELGNVWRSGVNTGLPGAKSELVAQSEFIRLNCLFNDNFYQENGIIGRDGNSEWRLRVRESRLSSFRLLGNEPDGDNLSNRLPITLIGDYS